MLLRCSYCEAILSLDGDELLFFAPSNVSLEATGAAARFGNKVVWCEWVENVAVGYAPAAQLKIVRQTGLVV